MTSNQRLDPDLAWVKLAQTNNSLAIKALYEKYFLSIYRFLFWQTGDAASAEDLTQETFLGLVKGIKKFKGQALFRNWLYQIAKYQLVAWIKVKSQQAESFWLDNLVAENSENWIDPDKQVLYLKKIQKLLKTLKKNERQVIELRFLRAYSVQETADKLNMTASNVKVITHRSLIKLRQNL